jgi:hypothetical protein
LFTARHIAKSKPKWEKHISLFIQETGKSCGEKCVAGERVQEFEQNFDLLPSLSLNIYTYIYSILSFYYSVLVTTVAHQIIFLIYNLSRKRFMQIIEKLQDCWKIQRLKHRYYTV